MQAYRIMSKRVIFCFLAGIVTLSLVISFFDQRYSALLKYRIGTTLAEEKSSKITQLGNEFNVAWDVIQQQVINQQREAIRNVMKDYRYPNGKYDISANKLEDLLIEENGKPIRSVIITTWRSGSTFLGEALGAHPGNLYHFETLIEFDISEIRGPPLGTKALKIARALFNCEYADLDQYIELLNTKPWFLNHTAHLTTPCSTHRGLCYRPEFLTGLCKIFPFQLMKLVRLRLSVAKELLADKSLGVRMVLLVRDPRGTLQSRKEFRWCERSRDCSDPALVCADLASDYKIAMELLKEYPTTFKVIRYEDLAAAPYTRVKELYEFYGRDYDEHVIQFLDTHTKSYEGDATTTFRDTKSTPYHWRSEMTFEEVDSIQRFCAVAMENWGYLPAISATHQKEFTPVTNYSLDL